MHEHDFDHDHVSITNGKQTVFLSGPLLLSLIDKKLLKVQNTLNGEHALICLLQPKLW